LESFLSITRYFGFLVHFFLTNVFSVAGRDRWIYGWSFAAI